MKAALMAIGTAATAWVLLSGSVMAAKPANQACLGQDIRVYAEAGSSFGTFISGMAVGTQGVVMKSRHIRPATSRTWISRTPATTKLPGPPGRSRHTILP